MTRYIDDHRERFGVEPICSTLQVAPSTFYAAKARPVSARARSDAALKPELLRIHQDNYAVYGVRKVWRQLLREGITVGRDRVARLMTELGLAGAVRGKTKRTTVPAALAARPGDLVQRSFSATAPNRLWVADLTYVATWSGFAYTAFIIDVFSRRIVGWRVATSLSVAVALDALALRGMRRILCEGGPHLVRDLIASGRLDELCLTLAPTLVGGDHPRITAGDPVAAHFVPRLLIEADGTLLGRWVRP